MTDDSQLYWQQMWSQVEIQPQPVPVYRLYHDDQGNPLFYSMDPLPGKYIEITREEFVKSSGHVKVVDNKLVDLSKYDIKKLAPHQNVGTVCCLESVAIVVDQDENGTRWGLKVYELN